VYRTSSLRTALARFDSPTNLSLRRLLANLALVGVRPIAADVSDIDTTDDLARWGGTGEVG
jgi:hypothetical protein